MTGTAIFFIEYSELVKCISYNELLRIYNEALYIYSIKPIRYTSISTIPNKSRVEI